MKCIKIVLIVLGIVAGFVLGILVNDISALQLDTKVRLFEPLSFLLTATIGILIPFFIKRWIDDSRLVKNHLVEELKDTLKEISVIKEKVKSCYYKKSITPSEKNEINALFEQADLKINSLEEQLSESFNKETLTLRTDLKSDYISYWKFMTGTEIMSSKFIVITDDFFRQHNDAFMHFEAKIKQGITEIYRL